MVPSVPMVIAAHRLALHCFVFSSGSQCRLGVYTAPANTMLPVSLPVPAGVTHVCNNSTCSTNFPITPNDGYGEVDMVTLVC